MEIRAKGLVSIEITLFLGKKWNSYQTSLIFLH